ncbi:unnamed protein product [Gulo gulo]|uniref:Uncharacterized protein n=1 Tax=Gulo gulo TaxID=48420 RepID=A0A9X9LRT3_GULGU|nr:unnamed protein product [Gulo gulo]
MPGFPPYHLYPIPSPTHTWESVLALSVWCLGPPESQPGRQSPDPCSPALLPLGLCKPGQTAHVPL